MPVSKTKFEVGDWIECPKPGLWRVYRVATYRGIDPVSGKEQSETAVFVKRFVTNGFKPSFDQACFDPEWLGPLPKKDAVRLRAFIAEHPALVAKFEAHEPAAIDSIYNAQVVVTKGLTKRAVAAKIPKDVFLTEPEIDPFLIGLGFTTKGSPSLTVQFVSPDFRIERGFLIYRFSKVF